MNSLVGVGHVKGVGGVGGGLGRGGGGIGDDGLLRQQLLSESPGHILTHSSG